jgi:hypothetical protein
MLRQLVLGGVVSLGTIAIHAVVMAMVVEAARFASKWNHGHPQLWLIAVMVATVGVLLVAHVVKVVVWSLAYVILDVAPAEAGALYIAFVNYPTLSYGDIVPVERWRLLGPLTAMNGVLLFGWSTAVIFERCASAVSETKVSARGSMGRGFGENICKANRSGPCTCACAGDTNGLDSLPPVDPTWISRSAGKTIRPGSVCSAGRCTRTDGRRPPWCYRRRRDAAPSAR